MSARRQLIVLSHLRWEWVWQRPQHLVSRLAADHDTWFVEEAVRTDVSEPRLQVEARDGLRRVWMELPDEPVGGGFLGAHGAVYARLLAQLVPGAAARRVWLYTPMAASLAEHLRPELVVYDVMDDLASFAGASEELPLRHAQLLRRADVVFTGGRSLHHAAARLRPQGTYLFPSGVDPEHYGAHAHRPPGNERPVAGYVGVIDERLDLGLLGQLARRLPDWDLKMIGPVAKIDPKRLPDGPNLHYFGKRSYDELPRIMAGFDVALMPFALNDATRSISPTKTLEYLAAGRPVVSTRVPDVVEAFGNVVDLQDDAGGFADACQRLLRHDPAHRRRQVEPLLELHRWDTIAERMAGLMAVHAGEATAVSA